MAITRRKVLVGLGAAGAGALLYGVRRVSQGASVFHDASAAREVGRAHLAASGPPQEASALRALLDPSDAGQAMEQLRARVRADFENGRTVSVGGWWLAQTEADLCALIAMED